MLFIATGKLPEMFDVCHGSISSSCAVDVVIVAWVDRMVQHQAMVNRHHTLG